MNRWKFGWKDGCVTEWTNIGTNDLLNKCTPYLCCLFCAAHRLHDQQPRRKAHQQADGEPVHDPQHLEGPVVRSGHQSDAP